MELSGPGLTQRQQDELIANFRAKADYHNSDFHTWRFSVVDPEIGGVEHSYISFYPTALEKRILPNIKRRSQALNHARWSQLVQEQAVR